MKEVTNLHPPNAGLIDHLEKLLAEARKGHVQSALFIIQWDDARVDHSWRFANNTKRTTMVGELMCAVTALSFSGTHHNKKLYDEED